MKIENWETIELRVITLTLPFKILLIILMLTNPIHPQNLEVEGKIKIVDDFNFLRFPTIQ